LPNIFLQEKQNQNKITTIPKKDDPLSQDIHPNHRMSLTLRLSDLHEDYRGASHEEAIAMANLGAVSYRSLKPELYVQWSASMEGGESAKAEAWRAEERQLVLESVRAKMVAAEEMSARLVSAEGTIRQLRASVEAEVNRKLAEALEGHRKDFEIAKMAEISGLKERIAAFEGKDGFVQMVLESQVFMKEKIAALEAQLAQQMAANTKSSQAIGKQGETIVLDLLENTVCKQFTHSVVKDMTTSPHAADFHLWIMTPLGKKLKILVDSKKYKRAVNSDEINKLYVDMDADEECNCGIMISIDSGICTKRQFCFSRTLKQKPVLFLSFQDISPDAQKDILCWGVQVLSEFVLERNDAARQEMLNKMDEFIDTLLVSVKDIDAAIRDQMKSVTTMKEFRSKILKSIAGFRGEEEVEEKGKVVLADDVRCVGLKNDGNRCSKRRSPESEYCTTHKK
jgi:hypothetical protein